MRGLAMNHLMRSPSAFAKFQATGQLPRTFKPDSPLIRLLEQISPRDRMAIRGVKIGPQLGYSGGPQFHTAEQALRWCKPCEELLETTSCSAESWRIKSFNQQLTLDDLLKCCTFVPEGIRERYKL